MKRRLEKTIPDDQAERSLVEEIRTLAGGSTRADQDARPATYWANLLVRTNQRIDDATSTKALSLSWAARVAIPGVVAVLSFVIALHYYAPVRPDRADSLASVMRTMPEQTLDSLLVAGAGRGDGALPAVGVGADIIDVSRDQIAEYFIDNGRETQLVESMDDQQANAFLNALSNR